MLLLLLALALPQDTVRYTHEALLDRASAQSGLLAGAEARARAARERLSTAGRLTNPSLQVQAENLGMQQEVTGKSGLEGTEGQIVLSQSVALGGDRGARREVAGAALASAEANHQLVGTSFRESVLLAMIDWERERALLVAMREERDALGAFATAMTARADEGRDAPSDAALARLESAAARSRHARQLAAASVANARLAAYLDLPVGTPVDLEPLACPILPALDHHDRSAELRSLDAGVQAAQAQLALTRAARVPDLHPQVGLRRSAGFSGLLLGLSMELPLFNSGGAAAEAARLELGAVLAERTASTLRLDGEGVAHRRALADLHALAPAHDATWREDLVTVVRAEEERLSVGEGSLFRLFDARRARLAAVQEHEAWRDAVRRHQVVLARLGFAPLEATLLCTPEDL